MPKMTEWQKTKRRRLLARIKALKAEIYAGLPTAEQMRASPPGALDRHRAWERKNKPKILAWRELHLTLRRMRVK